MKLYGIEKRLVRQYIEYIEGCRDRLAEKLKVVGYCAEEWPNVSKTLVKEVEGHFRNRRRIMYNRAKKLGKKRGAKKAVEEITKMLAGRGKIKFHDAHPTAEDYVIIMGNVSGAFDGPLKIEPGRGKAAACDVVDGNYYLSRMVFFESAIGAGKEFILHEKRHMEQENKDGTHRETMKSFDEHEKIISGFTGIESPESRKDLKKMADEAFYATLNAMDTFAGMYLFNEGDAEIAAIERLASTDGTAKELITNYVSLTGMSKQRKASRSVLYVLSPALILELKRRGYDKDTIKGYFVEAFQRYRDAPKGVKDRERKALLSTLRRKKYRDK